MDMLGSAFKDGKVHLITCFETTPGLVEDSNQVFPSTVSPVVQHLDVLAW